MKSPGAQISGLGVVNSRDVTGRYPGAHIWWRKRNYLFRLGTAPVLVFCGETISPWNLYGFLLVKKGRSNGPFCGWQGGPTFGHREMLSFAVHVGEPHNGVRRKKSRPGKSHVLSKFMALCWAAFIAVLKRVCLGRHA